jgi:oligosaccharide repeat unit polymerase
MQDIRYNQAMRRPLPLAARRDTGGKDSPFIHMHLLYRVGIVVLYIVVLLTIVVNLEVSSKSPAFTFLCLALVVNFAVVLLPVAFYKPHYGWFHPLVYLSIGYLAFHARSFATYLNGIGQHRALPTWSADDITMLIAYALALGALGNVAYFFGFFLGPEFRVPKIRFSHTSRFSVKAVVIVACTMVVFLLYMRSEGGLTAHLMSWQSGRHETMKGEGYWHLAIKFAGVVCILWSAIKPKAIYQPLFWVCAVLSVTMSFLATGSRGEVVFFCAIGMLTWMLREKKVAPTRVIMIGLLGATLVGLLGNFREQIWKGNIDLTTSRNDGSILEHFEEGAIEAGERAWGSNGTLPILALVPDEVDLLYGKSYLGMLTLPIPRAIWTDKPGQIGGMVGHTFFRSPAGVPPGPIGEAYWNFHIPGIIMVFFAFGVFQKWLMRVYLRYSDQPAMIVLYLITLFVIEPTTPTLATGLLLIVPAILLLRLMGALDFKAGSS